MRRAATICCFSPLWLVLFLLVPGCTLIFDSDNLLPPDKDTDPVDTDTGEICVSDAECADAVDCTEDVCGDDGACLHLPDNNRCDGLFYCDAADGCVPTGDECEVKESCDDSDDCTEDDCVSGTCQHMPYRIYFDGPTVDVVTAAGLRGPSLDSNGTLMGVIWQQEDGDVRDTRVRFFDADGVALDSALTLNSLGTAGNSGVGAAIAAAGETFHAIWSVLPASGPPVLQVISLDATDGAVTPGTPESIAVDPSVTAIISPVIIADEKQAPASWVAVWGTESAAGSKVYLLTEEMGAPLLLAETADAVGGISVARMTSGMDPDYAVAWAAGSEIRETRLRLKTDWQIDDGYPATVSADGQTCSDPWISDNGAGRRAVVWVQTDSASGDTGIAVSEGGNTYNLVEPSPRAPSRAFLEFGGKTFVFAVIEDVTTTASNRTVALRLEQYNRGLEVPGDRLAQARLLSASEEDDTWLSSPFMKVIGLQRSAVSWIRTGGPGTTTLQYGVVNYCAP